MFSIHGFNERKMNFFNLTTIPISNYCWENWVYIYDDLDIHEQFHLLYCQYSKHHNQRPKNVDPNNVSLNWKTLVANDENCVLSTSLPKYLYLEKADTQHEDVHEPC